MSGRPIKRTYEVVNDPHADERRELNTVRRMIAGSR